MNSKKILLVEPGNKNKFPPLGLMKISSYHKLKGDQVTFVKGCMPEVKQKTYDRIYIATVFSFLWDISVRTIEYYMKCTLTPKNIFLGGVMATLFADELEQKFGVSVVRGLLNQHGILDKGDKTIVDTLIPDYSILDDIEYKYGLEDCYIGHTTRGCPNRCKFCAVGKVEPDYCHYLPLKRQVRGIEQIYGAKQHLVLFDNNILASESFEQIVDDIVDLGFAKGALRNGRLRFVDFNQGNDVRLLTKTKMKSLAKTAIRPFRLAFDHISLKNIYIEKIKLSRDFGVLNLSNYILFNFTDKPEHFYERLRINVELNETIGTKIYSFPMRYIPVMSKDRAYVGIHWNRQMLRGIQCILLATMGKVGPRMDFFEAAFGKSFEEFKKIVLMPDEYIIYRREHENNGALDWKKTYEKLSTGQRHELEEVFAKGKINTKNIPKTASVRLSRLYSHYIEAAKLQSLRKEQAIPHNIVSSD